MTPAQTCEANARHFPDDATWQKHCQMIAAYRAAQLEVAGTAPSVAGKLGAFEKMGVAT